MSQQVEIQRLVDRAAIHDLHVRYFQGIDAADRDQVRSCFTADVRADYDRRRFVQGIDELMAVFQAFAKRTSGEWKSTSHFMGNLIFRALADESAQTEVYAFACLVTPGTGPDLVTIRSLRYLDRLRKTATGWRICDRVQTLDWSGEMPATFAGAFSERITAMLPQRTA
jgi:hypothetical protein